jgi:hypothetical protein
MKGVNAEHLCDVCKLGKEYGTTTCENVMAHAGRWNVK